MSLSLLNENDQRGLKTLDWSLGLEAQKHRLGNVWFSGENEQMGSP